jgi:peptide/nickel transport system substrate-binding protein
MRRLPLLSLIVPLAWGCADRPAGDDAATGGTVIVAVPGPFTPALPIHSTTATTANIASQVYDRLATAPADLNSFGDVGFTPRLAERWTWAADSMSIAFHLDPDARWHDGRPVRANDVKFSFDLSRDPKSGSAIAPLIANIDSFSVRDSLTAVAHFRSPPSSSTTSRTGCTSCRSTS